MNSSTECRDRGQLVIAIDQCGDSLGSLHEAVSLLEKRLESVLESRPMPGQLASQPAPSPTMLADRVGAVHNGMLSAQARIHDLMARLHV